VAMPQAQAKYAFAPPAVWPPVMAKSRIGRSSDVCADDRSHLG